MSKIIYTKDKKLYLGDAFDANNEIFLQEKNINTIICVAEDAKITLKNSKITIYNYDLQDTYECNISLYFDEIFNIIHKHDVVLVHCVAGISRSASFVIAYLMKYYELSLKDAFLYVKRKRDRICPNKKFMTYLYEYEFKLFGENSLTYDECINLFYYT
uniref:Tyrosine specific protein phosphatases domain-containing protein n=1 Tax=viral metagenome TaxID=1070528 RepID=A0A6C0IVZ1_9ZZZZ